MTKKRETLNDLINLGLVNPGSEIEMMSSGGKPVQATIMQNGDIKLPTGEIFKSPSSAARFLRNGVSSNGWRTWRLTSNAMQIGTLRSINSKG